MLWQWKIPQPQRVNQTELYFPLSLDVQQSLARAWLTVVTQGPRLLVALSWHMLAWPLQQWDKNVMNCTLSLKASLAKASHMATPNLSGDWQCSPAMCLEGGLACRPSSHQQSSLAKTWLWMERILIPKHSCGQGQRWTICSNPTIHHPGKGRREKTMGSLMLLPSSALRSW